MRACWDSLISAAKVCDCVIYARRLQVCDIACLTAVSPK